MANSSSAVSTGQVITAAQYNNLRTDAIGPYGDERVFPDSTLLKFGTGEDASFQYDGTNLLIQPRDVGSGNVVINDAAILFVNDTANGNMTVGLTLNQGANDDHIVTLKSSDVATALTSGLTPNVETDDFAVITKLDATEGGLRIVGLAEDGGTAQRSVQILGVGGTPDTTKTTAAVGQVDVVVFEHDGANALANATANANVFTVRARIGGSTLARLMIDEDGDIYAAQDENAGLQTIDEYDDLALVRALDIAKHDNGARGYVKSEWDDFVRYNEDTLIETGVLGAPLAEGGMVCVTGLQRLHNGALWQLATRLFDTEKRMQVAEQRLAALQEGSL